MQSVYIVFSHKEKIIGVFTTYKAAFDYYCLNNGWYIETHTLQE